MEKKYQEKIDLLQEQVDQIQIKLLEDKKTKWYCNPSMVISIIALLSSLIFSINSILESRNTAKEQKQSLIIKNIEDLLDEEKKYVDISSSSYSDDAGKNNAYNQFNNRAQVLIDIISKNLEDKNLMRFDPNLLLNYGRVLNNLSKYDLAYKILNKVIASSKDSSIKSYGYRLLANFYANTVNRSYYDSTLSRNYRKKEVLISNTSIGENKFYNLSASYEFWAIDEYNLLKNTAFANKLIDSSIFYIRKVSNTQNRDIILNRLENTYSLNNDKITQFNIIGEYNVKSSDGKKGIAYISKSYNGLSIDYEYYSNNKLTLKMKGDGNFIVSDSLKFNIEIESYKNNEYYPNHFEGTLNLKTEKNRSLKGILNVYNKTPVEYLFQKK